MENYIVFREERKRMRVVNCRVADNIADGLHYAAQKQGKSQYNLIADLLTAYVVEGQKAEERGEDRLAIIEDSISSMQHNIRVMGSLVVALLTAQVGEEAAQKIVREITDRGEKG